jgi:hypothetical protein
VQLPNNPKCTNNGSGLQNSEHQVIYYLIEILVFAFSVICFGFDGINLDHVTSNLALFTSLSHNSVILWLQIQTNIKIEMWQAPLAHKRKAKINDCEIEY